MKIKKFIAAVSAVAISAMSLAAFGSFSAYAEDDARPSSYQFWLAGQYGGNDFWTAGENNNPAVTVSADGTEYTLKVTNTGETNDTDLILFIQSDVNVYKYSTNDTDNGLTNGLINIEITGIKVDGQSISYSRPANALSLDNDGKSFRLNIWNPHQGGATGPVKEGIDPNFEVTDSIEITFKTQGLFPEAPVTVVLTGDINGDTIVGAEDATRILIDAANFAANGVSELTSEQISRCDFDRNGVCNSVDASYILQYAAYQGAGGELSVDAWYAQGK